MNLEEELMAAGELSEAPQLPTDVSSREFDEWLDDEADNDEYDILHTYFETYWKTKQWPGSFNVKPLPPGSPI